MHFVNNIAVVFAIFLVTEILAAPGGDIRNGRPARVRVNNAGAIRHPIQRPFKAVSPDQHPLYFISPGPNRNQQIPVVYASEALEGDEYSDDKEEYDAGIPDDGEIRFIPVTDPNGDTYLVPQSALHSLPPPPQSHQPSPVSSQFAPVSAGGNAVLVPEKTISVEGEEIIDNDTGENTFVVPESAFHGLSGSNVIAILDEFAGAGKPQRLVIKKQKYRNTLNDDAITEVGALGPVDGLRLDEANPPPSADRRKPYRKRKRVQPDSQDSTDPVIKFGPFEVLLQNQRRFQYP